MVVGKVVAGSGEVGRGKSFIVLCFAVDLLVLRFKAGLLAKSSHNLSLLVSEVVL